jgi:uncharacterized protein
MSEPDSIEVEVAYARPDRQTVERLRLPPGSTAIDALRACGFLDRFAEIDAATVVLGIFGRVVRHDQPLVAGDRVEVYRPLRADPRTARRSRVRSGR